MDEMKTFITEARKKGLDDDAIRKSLETKGWETSSINMALLGLETPSPATAGPVATAEPKAPATPRSQATSSLSHLMAALHHVILWFFTASSAITIGGTVASLYGMNVSANALASMIAVTVITFIPYAILFAIFIGKNRKNPPLIPGKVWSIITICLHSVSAMIAAIVAVVNIITGGEHMYLVSAGLILLLDLIVVWTYSFAAFGLTAKRVREMTIALHLPLLIVMFGILFTLSLLNLGPAKHDEDLRKDMATLVRDIAGRTREQDKLPDSIDGLTKNRDITYQKLSDKKYKVCATFQASGSTSYSSYNSRSYEATDEFVDESQFYAPGKGNHCFELASGYFRDKEQDAMPKMEYSY